MSKLGKTRHTVEIDGKTFTFASGGVAMQAGGSVVSSLGDTEVLTTTTAGPVKDHLPFFPLTIDVEERMYASGQIPGGFFKREGKPPESAIVTARLTDRPMRPTFAEGLRNEVQVVNMILQTSKFDPYDVVAMNGSSVATMLSGIPFGGPIAAVRYALLRDGTWIAFPSYEELEEDGVFDMIVAGRVTEDDEVAILMIEAEATEDAWVKIDLGASQPTEEVVGEAIENVKPILRRLCEAQTDFVDEVGPRTGREFPRFPDYTDEVREAMEAATLDEVEELYHDADVAKQERSERLEQIRDRAVADLVEDPPTALADRDSGSLESEAKEAFRAVEKQVVRQLVANQGVRIDGRGTRDVRELTIDVEILPRTHGSALFQRGQTQVLSVLALGTTRENQIIDTLDPAEEKYFLHHYNFLPFSTGEARRMRSPKRREIGHGMLAERAVRPVLPSPDEWPYTVRIVSDVLTSNGSTSMASICGSILALMDAGVPIYAPVAGVAMGLIKEGDQFTTLTDIQGTEDFFGDMDFKVAGTREFITGLQLDTKLTGVPADVLQEALGQARDARLEILDAMTDVIAEPREEVAPTAPRVEIVTIPKDKIGDVIGPGGKIIREITEETGAEIDIDEEDGQGVARIYAEDGESADAALDWINSIANPTIPEEGERFHAPVVKTVDFGAFVNLVPGIDGLLHISEMSRVEGRRLDHGEEAVDVGEKVWVEIIEVLDGGKKFKLEWINEEPEDLQEAEEPAAEAEAEEPAAEADTGEPEPRGGARRRSRRGTSSSDAGDGEAGGDEADDETSDRSSGRTRTRTRSRERS